MVKTRHKFKRKIIRIQENSVIEESFLYLLGTASKEKEDNPKLELYLSFEKSMTSSRSFFKKLCIYAYENKLGLIIDRKDFLPCGGEEVLSKKNFELLLEENFG